MLDELIAERSQSQDHGRRIALRLQRIARVIVAPASALMVLGLVWYALSESDAAPGAASVVGINEILTRAVLTPLGAMSVGLLALALLPVINVLYILSDSLRVKRWADALVAAVVAGILMLGIIIGRA